MMGSLAEFKLDIVLVSLFFFFFFFLKRSAFFFSFFFFNEDLESDAYVLID